MMNDLAPDINFASPEWGRFQEWLAGELLDTYKRLANPATSTSQTDFARGQAAYIEKLLSLGQPLAGNKAR